MEKAKKFLKEKGLKDTLYNVKYNPNQNRGLPEKEWIHGGLSALLDEYADTKVKKFFSISVLGEVLSLDEITKTKQVKMNKNNYWLLKLIYGDAANDRTATFQIPHNVICRTLKR